MATSTNGTRSRRANEHAAGFPERPRAKNNNGNGTYSHEDYTVGWVCALPIEMAAAEAMLDQIHESLPQRPHDANNYTLGNIGGHNIVIACLPKDQYGTNRAATVSNNMKRSFPSMDKGLLVGIGGGVPGITDVRLGDVIVSDQVVQYDLGKAMPNGHFYPTSIPTRPPQILMTAVSRLKARHERLPNQLPSNISDMLSRYPRMSKYSHPRVQDRLFHRKYQHIPSTSGCANCDEFETITRPPRPSQDPEIHYGKIGSGNKVIRDGETRDSLAKKLGVICFEMEASGLMDNFPCLVIRGICDYSDSHKNKQWQEYSACAAAAYAKELLSAMPRVSERNVLMETVPHAQEILTKEHKRNILLESLDFRQIESRHATIKPAHTKTCDWLLSHHKYIEWLNINKFPTHRGFLWIYGKPGTGKSTLMKFAHASIQKEWRTEPNSGVLSFFFNDRGDELEKSTAGMYRSLILQALHMFTEMVWVLDDFYDEIYKDENNEASWDVDKLQKLFQRIIEPISNQRLACFIDALDECDETQIRTMITHFEELGEAASRHSTKLYVCFSSRHYPYINIKDGLKLILEDQIGHDHDLKEYVQSKFEAGSSKAGLEVADTILKKSSSVFMWVVLVVDILNQEFRRGRMFAVKQRLQETPEELSELFKDMLTRDNDNMDDLLLCLQWILYSYRPLSYEEFYFALVSGLDPRTDNLAPWDQEYITLEYMERFVLSSSKGLAEVTKSESKTVQFIHESVRDYLLKENGIQMLWPGYSKNLEARSHDKLKQCCHFYMNIDTSTVEAFNAEISKQTRSAIKSFLRKRILKKFPFLEYATEFIFDHATNAASIITQDEFLNNFNLTSWIKFNNIFTSRNSYVYPRTSLLCILARDNFANLFRTLVQQCSRRKFLARYYQRPLLIASEGGHDSIVQMILDMDGIDINFKDMIGDSALTLAAKRGHEAVIEILLDSRHILFDYENSDGSRALRMAAKHGHDTMVRRLLDTGGIDINDCDNLNQTALSLAIKNNHKGIAQLLRETGAKANAGDR